MNLYRITYEYPITAKRGRTTLAAKPHDILWMAQEIFCKPIGAYMLSINELRKCEINEELVLT